MGVRRRDSRNNLGTTFEPISVFLAVCAELLSSNAPVDVVVFLAVVVCVELDGSTSPSSNHDGGGGGGWQEGGRLPSFISKFVARAAIVTLLPQS